jgi:hypothetical protein
MINILFLVLTFLAGATAVWYAAFYQSPMPGATYATTYVYLSMGAALIFAGLFISGLVNRKRSNNNI